MKKSLWLLMVLAAGLFTTACSFHSETSIDKSISATKQLDSTEPAKVVTSSKPKLPSAAAVQKTNEGGVKTCNKHEECNKVDELCYWGTCQTVAQIKQGLGFNDDFSNDPCPEKTCVNCTEGKMKNSGMAYGIDDINIQASVCIECMFNDACKTGFRCLHEQCVDPSTSNYCDFSHDCLEGYTCENEQCVKGVAQAPSEKTTEADSPKKVVSAPSSNGKKCNKHEECNMADELCYWGTCQSVAQIKQTLGFNDDFSNDPCSEKTCANCTDGKMKKSGMGYGVDDIDIQASVCIACMFNEACEPGYRCLYEQCVPANEINSFCDPLHECLEGFTCKSEKCVKSADAPASN